jgi:hypothetical protein
VADAIDEQGFDIWPKVIQGRILLDDLIPCIEREQ